MEPLSIITIIGASLGIIERIAAFFRTKKKVRVLTENIETARHVIRAVTPRGAELDARLVQRLRQTQAAAGVQASIGRAVAAVDKAAAKGAAMLVAKEIK